MAYEQSEMDPETLRSYSRQIYGHEIWLDKIEKADGYISIYGLYGHTMVPDKPMPTDYANVILYDDNGRVEDPDREIVKNPHGWLFSFEDKGADVYTLYVDSNSTWVTNDEGWHRGVKKDFANVKYSGAFNMVAKRIISKDGVNPGSVMHCALELMPEKATLKVGEDAKIKVFYEGKPLPKAKVICYAKDDEDFVTYHADENGVLTYPVKKKAMHAFIAKYTDENKCVDDEFDEMGFTTTLTLEAE
ncbi:MAG: DUF4198 domain-containing protein [Candidatus Methanomethylophilaceae archaeon]|nr:DUF4198 domain-containing protein [Candidatus Methanomethylophilaceae archaeon]